MLVVRGTKKFLDRVGPPDPAPAPSTGVLSEWYANVWFWRPQVAVFVNEQTLLPVLVPFAPAASVLDRFPAQFAQVARRIVGDIAAVDQEVDTMHERTLARTASRSVLGTMNEFGHMADHYRWTNDVIDLVELSLWLAQVPCSPLFGGKGSPARELRAILR